ncbi:MAG: stage III sporulation protein AE [Oscillospiraceae bacterium]|nr:stage III sporulation protein AE [Oscillospiraceae bacterium]
MKKLIILLLLICCTLLPVSAMEFTAPTAPESAQPFMPEDRETFSEGLWYILKTAIGALRPELAGASGICLALICMVLLLSILNSFSQGSVATVRLTGAVVIGLLLLDSVNSMIQLGAKTVIEISEYGKLLLPVMTAAVAAQGGTTSSAALYTGTVFFDTVLTSAIAKVVVPALYIYLCLCVAGSAVEQDMLKKVRDFVKQVMTWCLKGILYLFTGYISITHVITGTVDASALKAAKLAISGTVPVVGSILSSASETILVSASVMKNAAGIYGIFAILALCVSPFLQIGVQYLLLKLTGAVCNLFGYKPAVELIHNFSTGMGMVLAMTGTVCVLLLVSLVCFMKGMT